ncbi:MAG: hypothetical protein WBC70_14635 [Candidatus Aminicenantales bacterium]
MSEVTCPCQLSIALPRASWRDILGNLAIALLWAEAKLGELLPKKKDEIMKESRRSSRKGTSLKSLPSGITKKQSHYAQRLAARRIGELCPPLPVGRGKKNIRTADNFPEPQRLSEFRKLAENAKGKGQEEDK